MHDLLALAWVIAVWLSVFGFGRVVTKGLRLTAGAGETGCYGVAALIAIGGVLNCLGWALPIVNMVLIVPTAIIGVWWLATTVPWRIALPSNTVSMCLGAAVLLLATYAVVIYLYDYSFSSWDDFPAYMAFPAKMLTGSLGFEPFSERRLLTSLGGLYYLQSVVLTGAPFPWPHSVDPSLATVLTLLVLDDALRRRRVSGLRRLGIILFLLLFPPLVLNLSAGLLQVPFLILLCLSRGITPGGCSSDGGRTIPTALLVSAVIAIKPLQLPFLFFVLAGDWAVRLWREDRRGRVLAEALGTTAATLGLLLMWLIGNALQVGTPLYPLMGSGNITSRYNHAVPSLASMMPLSDRVMSFLIAGLLNPPVLLMMGLFLAFCLVAWHGRDPNRILLPGLCVIGTLAVDLALCLAGSGEFSLNRYLYPCTVTSILVLLVAFPKVDGLGPAWAYGAPVFTVAACALAVAGQRAEVLEYYRTGLLNLRILYSGPNPSHVDFYDTFHRISGANALAIRKMQDTVPPGEAILERIDYPYLMDFHRNTVFIADWPGSVGPAPGWPLSNGAKRLAAYLTQSDVRYIAFSYNSEAVITRADVGNNSKASKDAWIQSDISRLLEFQDNVATLSSVCPIVFRDTRRFMVHITDDCVKAMPPPKP